MPKEKTPEVCCICGEVVKTHGGSSYRFAEDGSKIKMCSTSVSCPKCELSLPRGRWFDTNEESKKDALERWMRTVFPLSVGMKKDGWKA